MGEGGGRYGDELSGVAVTPHFRVTFSSCSGRGRKAEVEQRGHKFHSPHY
jgi:hypothetical protein